ncbi:MAG: hypothetical protein HXX08_13595 [Chloroflexi bacterium]|uniref:Uncharacterized protein n=1 Tax=Candidatus Chlorohelix allophototropha TaxID=3003348 RepID=A0A8T7M4A4_9CHLR|nr:hypothetical protein [Chloroflexota bacterium]WJW70116.1 hypothetical protein OZ401_004619 [Chloroflexota bacterium L227-S17]
MAESADSCGRCNANLEKVAAEGRCGICGAALCLLCWRSGQRYCLLHQPVSQPLSYFTCGRCHRRFSVKLLAGSCQSEEFCPKQICTNCREKYREEGRLWCQEHAPANPVVVASGLPTRLDGTLSTEQERAATLFFARLDKKLAEAGTLQHPLRENARLKVGAFSRRRFGSKLELVSPGKHSGEGLGLLVSLLFEGSATGIEEALNEGKRLAGQHLAHIFTVVALAGGEWEAEAQEWLRYTSPHQTLCLVKVSEESDPECLYAGDPLYQSLLDLFRPEVAEELVQRAIRWLEQDNGEWLNWLKGERSFSAAELGEGLKVGAGRAHHLLNEMERRGIGRLEKRNGQLRLCRKGN